MCQNWCFHPVYRLKVVQQSKSCLIWSSTTWTRGCVCWNNCLGIKGRIEWEYHGISMIHDNKATWYGNDTRMVLSQLSKYLEIIYLWQHPGIFRCVKVTAESTQANPSSSKHGNCNCFSLGRNCQRVPSTLAMFPLSSSAAWHEGCSFGSVPM